ncbi:MAG: hypothetical protein HQL51_07905 [Magnetococcales bacterium]|nr:hypothetical protein [Magnetococcales bacterium]
MRAAEEEEQSGNQREADFLRELAKRGGSDAEPGYVTNLLDESFKIHLEAGRVKEEYWAKEAEENRRGNSPDWERKLSGSRLGVALGEGEYLPQFTDEEKMYIMRQFRYNFRVGIGDVPEWKPFMPRELAVRLGMDENGRFDPNGPFYWMNPPDPNQIIPPEIYPGVDMDSVVQLGREHYGNLNWFRKHVQTGGEGDYKNKFKKSLGVGDVMPEKNPYENFGNFHYGVLGRSVGIPDQVLLRVAGGYQLWSGTSTRVFSSFAGRPPYGDDPEDQWWIQQGINFYNRHYGNRP